MLNESIKEILLKSGWYPERRIDISIYKDLALKEGYEWFVNVQYSLSEFGDLKISYVRRNGNSDLLHFNAVKAMQDIDSAWVKEDYSSRLGGRKLIPIGQAYSNHITLLMSDEGSVYGGFDSNLYFIGDNVKRAIEAICLDEKLLEIGST